MTIRSWLFVPGDSDRKLERALQSGADALLLDLEDSVVAEAKPAARKNIARVLASRTPALPGPELWVRINPLDKEALVDLAAVVFARPDGIMLPKADGPPDALRLSFYLDALEARESLPAGGIAVFPVATETAMAPFALGGYASATLPRLSALTWGAEDLATALGASTNRDMSGEFAFTYRWVRSAMLLAAKAAGVPAIETIHTDFRDHEGLEATCRAAAREGFNGRMAIHPDQVAIINAAFSPSDADVAFARRVIFAFDAAPNAGTVGMDGKMLDIPHLKQARQVLRAHEALLLRRGIMN